MQQHHPEQLTIHQDDLQPKQESGDIDALGRSVHPPTLEVPLPQTHEIKLKHDRLRLALPICIAAVIVVGASLLGPILFMPTPPLLPASSQPPPQLSSAKQVGTLLFASSGQLNPTSTTGINDVVTLTLRPGNVAPPRAGLTDYAWLMPDNAESGAKPMLLGTLHIRAGQVQLSFNSLDHSDLLASYSRLLITQQAALPLPTRPSSQTTWLYQGAIPAIPTSGDELQYSFLDHLRHLLAKDPTLESIGLAGGLGIWLYRNTEKVLEWANAARDDWAGGDVADLHNQLIRILDYLDGAIRVSGDVSPSAPFLVDAKAGRLGLLNVEQGQTPPGFFVHINIHLTGLVHAPGASPEQKVRAGTIDQALNAAADLLEMVRSDARALVTMSNAQVKQARGLSLLDDMATKATRAFSGQFDPATGSVHDGVAWLVAQMETLASLAVFQIMR